MHVRREDACVMPAGAGEHGAHACAATALSRGYIQKWTSRTMGAHMSERQGGGGDTVKRTQQREKHSSQVNGRAIANAGVRGAGDVTLAPPAAADARRRRARAPPRDPESPKKAAPQDLFTTPGYHDPHPPVVWGMCGAAPREYVEPPVIPHVVSRTQCGNHGS